MKEKHNIDELFREKLAEHTSPVPDHLWEGVVAKLAHAPKRRGGFGLAWLAILGFVLVGSGAYLSISQYSTSERNATPGSTEVISKAAVLNVENPPAKRSSNISPGSTLISADTNNTGGPGSERSLIVVKTDRRENETSPSEKNGQAMAAILKSAEETNSRGLATNSTPQQFKASSEHGGTDPGVLTVVHENGALLQDTHSGPDSNTDSGIEQNSSDAKAVSAELALTIKENETLSLKGGSDRRSRSTLPLELLDVSIRPSALNGTKPFLEPISVTPPKDQHGPNTHTFFIDVVAGYYAVNGSWVARQNDNDLRETTESFTNAYGLGLRGGVQIKNEWVVTAGLIYNKVSSKVEFNKVRYDTTIQFTFTDSTIFDQNTNSWDTILVAAIGSLNSTTTTNLGTNNTYNMLQVPVSAGYLIKHGRIGISINAGLSLDLLLSKEALYPVLYQETSTSIIQLPSSEIATLQQGNSSIRSGISLFGSVSFSYGLTERFGLFIEPTYRGGTIPLNTGGGSYFNPGYWGVLGGLRGNF